MESVNTKYSYFRYDKWGRCVFYLWKKTNYWSECKYNKAETLQGANVTPTEVKHKYSEHYN